jgi:hypothetical protein
VNPLATGPQDAPLDPPRVAVSTFTPVKVRSTLVDSHAGQGGLLPVE